MWALGTPCGIACRVERLKLKVDGTMVKLGRAAGLTGAMHEGGKKKWEGNKKKKKVKANFVSLIHGYEKIPYCSKVILGSPIGK